MMTVTQAQALVESRIPGTRKGSDEPAFKHSLRVGDTVKRYGYDEETVIAAILHDVIEDGGVTKQELLELGYTESIVNLVELCTHDDMIEGGDARWVDMMAGLVHAKSEKAWAIKIADAWDNMISAETMPADRKRFLRQAKAPMLAAISYDVMNETAIWKEYREQVMIYRDRI